MAGDGRRAQAQNVELRAQVDELRAQLEARPVQSETRAEVEARAQAEVLKKEYPNRLQMLVNMEFM